MTVAGVTFARDDGVYPPARDDWARLARAAASIAADRAARDPALVASGRLAPAEADRRARIGAALAELWRRAAAGEPLPAPIDWPAALGASLAELRDDCARAADAAARRNDPALAESVRALAWHLDPVAPGALPHIWIAADYAAWAQRASRAAVA